MQWPKTDGNTILLQPYCFPSKRFDSFFFIDPSVSCLQTLVILGFTQFFPKDIIPWPFFSISILPTTY